MEWISEFPFTKSEIDIGSVRLGGVSAAEGQAGLLVNLGCHGAKMIEGRGSDECFCRVQNQDVPASGW